MNYDEKAEAMTTILGGRTFSSEAEANAFSIQMMAGALRESASEALRDVCDELIEKWEGQGKTMTAAIMHIRAKAAALRSASAIPAAPKPYAHEKTYWSEPGWVELCAGCHEPTPPPKLPAPTDAKEGGR